MDTAFVFNTVINVALGAALLLAWHRDRTQAFLRMVGLAFIVHAGLPLGVVVMAAGGRVLQGYLYARPLARSVPLRLAASAGP